MAVNDDFEDSGRVSFVDKKFVTDKIPKDLSNHYFLRLSAKAITFENVDFKYSIFDTSYFRNCTFNRCDFKGCRFYGVNFRGATFHNCAFDYAIFERTLISSNILHSECPIHDNLKREFAKTLRINYQQIGDSQAVNEAIKIELQAEEKHLKNVWSSRQSYYVNKYSNLDRVAYFFKWIVFKLFDFIWGNGESIPKSLRFLALYISVCFFFELYFAHTVFNDVNICVCFEKVFRLVLGISKGCCYPTWYLSLTAVFRLLFMGFFISLCVKRLGRR